MKSLGQTGSPTYLVREAGLNLSLKGKRSEVTASNACLGNLGKFRHDLNDLSRFHAGLLAQHQS